MDTDSLTYEIEAEDVYADFWKHKDMFDNSDYNVDNKYFDATNKKVIGKFKDEAAGVPIVEFVGLRSKMYSYIKDNNSIFQFNSIYLPLTKKYNIKKKKKNSQRYQKECDQK